MTTRSLHREAEEDKFPTQLILLVFTVANKQLSTKTDRQTATNALLHLCRISIKHDFNNSGKYCYRLYNND